MVMLVCLGYTRLTLLECLARSSVVGPFLLADGQMIAIRRGTATRLAEVWEVDAAGNKMQLGSTITCTDAGSMVALMETSSGATRIAVGCEFDGSGESGLTKVLDYNGTDWVELASSPLSMDPMGVMDGSLW